MIGISWLEGCKRTRRKQTQDFIRHQLPRPSQSLIHTFSNECWHLCTNPSAVSTSASIHTSPIDEFRMLDDEYLWEYFPRQFLCMQMLMHVCYQEEYVGVGVVHMYLSLVIVLVLTRSRGFSCNCVSLPAGRIMIATTAVTVTVGKKTAIAGGKKTTF